MIRDVHVIEKVTSVVGSVYNRVRMPTYLNSEDRPVISDRFMHWKLVLEDLLTPGTGNMEGLLEF